MSTDVIDAAGQATRAVKLAFKHIHDQLDQIDLTCNVHGILNDPGMALADLDGVLRAVAHAQSLIINSHWPTVAEYSEV